MTASLRARRLLPGIAARLGLAALVVLGAAADAVAQDAWVSAKERPAGIALADRVYDPQGALKLFGVVEVHPSFRQSLMWDDNIFLSDN